MHQINDIKYVINLINSKNLFYFDMTNLLARMNCNLSE